MKKLEFLLILSAIAVCSVSLVGCRHKEPISTEKPELTSPEKMLEVAKPAVAPAKSTVEEAKPAAGMPN